MASVGNPKRAGEQQEISRKRKRTFHREIPTSTPSLTSTPGVVSQAPKGINSAEFAEARALEIQNMVEAMKDGDRTSGKRIFQTLPRHMRRRAMSYNVKRMPVSLRQRASQEMKNASSNPEVPKKKSRHQRRKPKNLLEEYTRRQRKHIWLETHIWHAKRMKMIDAWGYRLAVHRNDKGFRAVYRATKNSCLLQDISYYGCIEVSGVQSLIIEAMSHLTTQEAGLSMAAKSYIDGSKEGHIILYKMDQYPWGAIGPVSFLWRPKGRTKSTATNKNIQQLESSRTGMGIVDERAQVDTEKKLFSENEAIESFPKDCHRIVDKKVDSQLWIWSHPACYHSVFSEVVAACKCVGPTSVREDAPQDTSVDHGSQQDARTLLFANGHGFVSDTSGLTVTSRRFDLLRLHLTGPQSHAVLASSLQIPHDWRQTAAKISHGEHNTFDSNSKNKDNEKRLSNWWQDALNDKSSLIWDNFKRMWSPSVFPPGCVIGLCVLDPRLNLPGKKQSTTSIVEEVNSTGQSFATETAYNSGVMVMNSNEVGNISKKKDLSSESVISQWPFGVADSHIWEESICREVKQSKISEQELNRKRSELLVPGSPLNLSEEEISHIPLLVIQQPGSSGNSKDPGANPAYGSGWDVILPSGWAMAFWIAFVYRGARVGGLKEGHTLALEQGVPFFPNDFPDTPAGESYCKELKDDGEAKYGRYPPAKRPNYQKLGVKSPFSPPWKQIVEEWSACEEDSSKTQTSLEDASLSAEESQKGIERTFYVLRSRSSLSVLRRYFKKRCEQSGMKGSKQQASLHEVPVPVDELWSIVGNNPRALVFVSLRMTNRGIPQPNSSVSIPSRDDVEKLSKHKEYLGPVESLHKGQRPETGQKSLKFSCQREIVGYVSSGHFSLSRGCGFAVGFCALPGLAKLLMSTSFRGEAIGLVRGPASQQYRFAYLSIL